MLPAPGLIAAAKTAITVINLIVPKFHVKLKIPFLQHFYKESG